MLIREKAEKIFNYKSYTKKRKIDNLLELIADQNSNLGIDSRKTTKQQAKKDSRFIYRLIRNLDYDTGKLLLRYHE